MEGPCLNWVYCGGWWVLKPGTNGGHRDCRTRLSASCAPVRVQSSVWPRSAIKRWCLQSGLSAASLRATASVLAAVWFEANYILSLFPVRFTYRRDLSNCAGTVKFRDTYSIDQVVTCTQGAPSSQSRVRRDRAANIINKYKLNFHSVTLSKDPNI